MVTLTAQDELQAAARQLHEAHALNERLRAGYRSVLFDNAALVADKATLTNKVDSLEFQVDRLHKRLVGVA